MISRLILVVYVDLRMFFILSFFFELMWWVECFVMD